MTASVALEYFMYAGEGQMVRTTLRDSRIKWFAGSVVALLTLLPILSGCGLASDLTQKKAETAFAMRAEGGCGLMNCQGEWVLEPVGQEVGLISGPMTDGWALLMDINQNSFNYINSKGELLLQEPVERGMPFFGGLAAVGVDGAWGFIDTKGEMVIAPQFVSNFIGNFSGGLANVAVETNDLGMPLSWIFINEKGGKVLGPYDGTGAFSNGYASASLITEDQHLQSGFIDAQGEFVLMFTEEDDLRPNGLYGEGLFPVVDAQKQLSEGTCSRGYMDKEANWVVEPLYCGTGVFSEGLAPVSRSMEQPMLWGYIDTKGEMVIPESFVQAEPFQGGCARVFWDNYNGIGLINEKGEFIYKYEPEG